tara:strand:- start:6692 stop:7912 length:1221 start_codon:yes stop_codon:yes gene_type:complete
MRKRFKFLLASSSIGGLYILFEYYIHKRRTKQIKEQKKVLSKSPSCGTLDRLKYDILIAEGIEKEDMLITLKECFDVDNPEELSLETLTKVLHDNHPSKKDTIIDDFIHKPLPFTIQITMSIANWLTFKILESNCNIDTYEGDCIIHSFFPKKNIRSDKYVKYKKTFILFAGLSGSVVQLFKLINILVKNDYDILLPMYGPGDLSLNHNLNHNQYDYCHEIIKFLLKQDIRNVHLFAWSLGGIKYLCFESLILNDKSLSSKIKIKTVHLFEPLLTSRAVIDMHFTSRRSIFRTIQIVNSRTRKNNFKYLLLNCIMGYFIHTVLGFGCANSTDYLYHTEHKHNNIVYPYERYLYISTNDFLFNDTADKHVIENNFNKENVFSRIGYHGGWLRSSQLEKTFGSIISQN